MRLMNDLADKKCIPCEGGIPSFNLEEIHKYLKVNQNQIFLFLKNNMKK